MVPLPTHPESFLCEVTMSVSEVYLSRNWVVGTGYPQPRTVYEKNYTVKIISNNEMSFLVMV